MGKATKSAKKKIGGPFLACAVFCESIMEDANGSLSAIRIMDSCQLYLSPQAPPDVPSKKQPLQFAQSILLIFRSGDSPGKHQLKLLIQPPNGKASEALTQEVTFSKPPHGGANIKTHANMSIYTSGVYYVDVILDGKRYTRMPLSVTIGRIPVGGQISQK